MAVLSREDFMGAINEKYADDTSDETLAFIENVSDTLDDYEARAKGDSEDWKAKFEENDKMWREKYRNRFFSGDPTPEPDEPPEDVMLEDENVTPTKFEDLFKEE